MDESILSFQCQYNKSNTERCQLRKSIGSIYCYKHHSKFEKDGTCPVCTLKVTKCLRPCEHWVCKVCIIKSGKPECPICRTHVYLSKTERNAMLREARLHAKKKEEEERRALIDEFGMDEFGMDDS